MDKVAKRNSSNLRDVLKDNMTSVSKIYRAHYEDSLGPDLDPGAIKNVNQITKSGDTLLHQLAKRKGNFEQDQKYLDYTQAVLANHADVNLVDRDGFTALHWGARNGHRGFVRLLLEQKPRDIDTSIGGSCARRLIEDLGISTSHIASFTANDKLEEYLREGREDEFVASAGQLENIYHANRFLVDACRAGQAKVVEYLIGHLGTFRKLRDNWMLFSLSCKYGLSELLELTVAEDLDLDWNEVLVNLLMRRDEKPLRISDIRKCCRVFMESKGGLINVDRKYKGYSLIQYSIIFGADDITTALLQQTTFLSQNETIRFKDVCYEDMKDYFDYCISEDRQHITFNYRTLVQDGKKMEIEPFRYIAESSELSPLLKHPLIMTFIDIKWEKIRWIFYANFAFSLIFCLSLLLYIFLYYTNENNTRPTAFFTFLLVTNVFLSLREILQLSIAPRLYFENFENYVEVAMNLVVYLILFIDYSNFEIKRQISAVVILLIAFELLFILGSYPYLSNNIAMFRSVSLGYLKFLLFYFILILGFALCFYLLYGHKVDSKDENFYNPFIALFKTVIMLTGEFDSGNLNLDKYPVVGHIVFVVFVFSIAIILANLLNGLAVSDVQEVRNEAEVLVLKSRTEYIAYVEAMLGNCTFDLIQSYIINVARKKFSVNDNLLVVCHDPARCKGKRCGMVHLDKATLAETKIILRQKLDNQLSLKEKRKYEEDMDKMKEVCDAIFDSLKAILASINSKPK